MIGVDSEQSKSWAMLMEILKANPLEEPSGGHLKEIIMKRKQTYLIIGVVLTSLLAALVLALIHPGQTAADSNQPEAINLGPVGTGFSYQGYLDNGGNPADGFYDFQFSLFDAGAAGNQVGSTISLSPVTVSEGLFTVELDFGQSAFGGGARWLEISVRPSGGGAYTTLSPRQELAPALSALSLPNVYTNESSNFVGVGRDFSISGNEVFGVRYVGDANQYGGMYVETAHANGWPFYGYATGGSFRAWTYYNGTNGDWYLYNAGIRLAVPNEGGLRIGPSANYSLVISNTTGSDGVRIYDTGDDAIQIGSDPDYSNYGVYIPSPGVSTYGLWPNTADPAGQWALFTVDNIEAGNVFANAYSLVAKVTDPNPLTVGDVVAVTGVTDPIPGGTVPLPLVRAANEAAFTGVVGVLASRMAWEVAPGKEAEGEMSMHSASGPAMPGDYVALVIYGITEVKVAPGANIAAGDRLTVAEAGQVRALQTRTVEGMVVTEGAQVVGIALAAPVAGQETIPVFVTLR